MLTLDKFEEAYNTVSKVVNQTKLIQSDFFSEQSGNKVFLKPENLQVTGAYKIRGAYYKISTLSEEERSRGLITASAGNHAQGVAFAAKAYGVKATIVMPTTTPLIKVNRTKAYGADVILYGDVYDESCQYALELAEDKGLTFIHPFDDLDVACGQGSIAMEIIKELPTVDYILVPIGGGGLATGVSTLAKMLNPNIKVIGVEPAGAACMKTSLKHNKITTLPYVDTIADGTAVKTPGSNIFPYIKENIDEIINIVSTLIEKGYAYAVDNGDVYFSPKKFNEYGKLSHQPLEDLEAGARISVEEVKHEPMDFALWKSAKPGEPYWESPWGHGRPGWHIECSAMVRRYLGETIDIHCGGQDLVFPHHENEIAQSECCNGVPFANYWMHNGFISVDNVKMSKSLGNFFTVRDVANEYGYEPIRYFLISSHYRSPINYSVDIIEQCKASLVRLYNCRERRTREALHCSMISTL